MDPIWSPSLWCQISGVMVVTIIAVNFFTHKDWYFWHWTINEQQSAPCHDLEVIPVWSQRFPKLLSESSIRMLNVSDDDMLDVVFGFGTGQSEDQPLHQYVSDHLLVLRRGWLQRP